MTTEMISGRLLLMGYRIFERKPNVEVSKNQEVVAVVDEEQVECGLNPVEVRVKNMHVETSRVTQSEGVSDASQGESEKSSSLHLDDFSDSGVLTRSSRSNLEELIAKVSL